MRDMRRCFEDFWRDERGQDLVEYALCVAFIVLASAALFFGDGPAEAAAVSAPHAS